MIQDILYRRKFRSQTSDNMDRWKEEQGRGREKRKIRREKSRRERVRRKKMDMREKVGKSRFTVFFKWFVAPEGRKVGSLKRWVRSQLARGEMNNCTPLWREAHFQVKTLKNTSGWDHFWHLRCRKSARRCGAKHISKWKCTKHTSFGPLLEVEMSKKCTLLWREAHFQGNMLKALGVRTTFGRSDLVSRGRRKGLCTVLKREKQRKKEKERRPQPPFGPSAASLRHPWVTTTNFSYRFPILETSATALCGTTGAAGIFMSKCHFSYPYIPQPGFFPPLRKPYSYLKTAICGIGFEVTARGRSRHKLAKHWGHGLW